MTTQSTFLSSKICIQCGQAKPLSAFEFVSTEIGKVYNTICVNCRSLDPSLTTEIEEGQEGETSATSTLALDNKKRQFLDEQSKQHHKQAVLAKQKEIIKKAQITQQEQQTTDSLKQNKIAYKTPPSNLFNATTFNANNAKTGPHSPVRPASQNEGLKTENPQPSTEGSELDLTKKGGAYQALPVSGKISHSLFITFKKLLGKSAPINAYTRNSDVLDAKTPSPPVTILKETIPLSSTPNKLEGNLPTQPYKTKK